MRQPTIYDFSGRTAVVTGGTKGIGLAIARTLLTGGAQVVLASRSQASGDAALAELSAGDKACFIATDITKQDQCEALIDGAVARFGAVDILVNHAGGVDRFFPIAQMPDDAWARTIDLNLNSTFWCCRRALPLMVERGWGRIINTSTMVALEPQPAVAHYASTKRALHAFTRVLCHEGGPFGVTSNVISPGLTRTEMVEAQVPQVATAQGITGDEWFAAMEQRSPIRRLIRPEDIAEVAGFLCTDAASAVNGQILRVDGGTSEP